MQGLNLNREGYKSKRKSQPKRNMQITRAKKQMMAKPKEISSTPKLRLIYSTKIEWATKMLPKLKEQFIQKKFFPSFINYFKICFSFAPSPFKPFSSTDRLLSKFYIKEACKSICKVIKQEVKNSMSYPKEMHKATCADCGKECEVPFKPDGTRPVYCRECYSKRRPPRRY